MSKSLKEELASMSRSFWNNHLEYKSLVKQMVEKAKMGETTVVINQKMDIKIRKMLRYNGLSVVYGTHKGGQPFTKVTWGLGEI